VLVLALAEPQMRTASRLLAQMENSPVAPNGLKGMFIDTPHPPAELRTSFDPFLWSAANYFRKTNTILMNAPWLDLPILPIGGKEQLFASRIPAHSIDYPDFLVGELIRSGQLREQLSPDLDFLVFVGYGVAEDRLLREPWPHLWDCQAAGWFTVCNSRPKRPVP
jgi:hypothetical protein